MSEKRFSFVKEEDVEEIREGDEPGNTKRHTLWSSNCYAKWAEAREEHFRDIEPEDGRFRTVPKLEDINVDEMNYWLSRFALEVRKRDGANYRHEALYSLFCGLNRVIKEKHPALSLFHSTELKPFQKALDGRLKELQATQQPLQSTDALSVSDEMTMWAKGVLGTHSPDALLNTLLFLSGKLFVLRGGRELRSLTHDQIGFEEMQDRSMCVTYKGNASKTNQGGLKRRKVEPKVVQHVEDPLDEKSFSFIYHSYVNKCPEDARIAAVFLRPKVKWNSGDEIWFEKSPVGHNLLQNRFKEMCKQAGLVGNFTNRSIRRTAVTHMYESGLMEKTIMIRSGHSSTDGVKAYPREYAGSCRKSNEEIYQIKNKLQLAEEKARMAENALHQALSDLDTMRADIHSIVLDVDHDNETGTIHNLDEDDGYFSTYAHYSIHEEMLKDKVRTLSYKKFIEKNRSLFQDKVVLDVGCGSGILSIFAAKAGAKKVIGIDKSSIIYNAMDIVRENKCDSTVNLIRGKAEEVYLDVEQVDVIISEWMGYFLLFESMLDTVLFARDKWLSNNGRVYPDKCTMSLVGLSDHKRSEEKLNYWDNVYGVKMSCMKHFVLSEPVVDVVDQDVVITNSCIIKEIDVNKVKKEELDFKSSFQLEAYQDGTLNIILGYFDIFFDEGCTEKVSFSTHPRSAVTHWKQTLFYLENPVMLKKGEVVNGSLQCCKNRKDVRSLDIVLELEDNLSKELITNKYTLQ